MTDITPKTRLEGQRGYVIHTQPWEVIAEHYRKQVAFAPMLHLVEVIGASPIASQLFAATSMFDLLLSDSADFRIGDSTLRISYRPSEHRFDFQHTSYSGHDDQKVCAEHESLQTLRLFLRLKYGVLFEIPAA
jgi:hypothetical protein